MPKRTVSETARQGEKERRAERENKSSSNGNRKENRAGTQARTDLLIERRHGQTPNGHAVHHGTARTDVQKRKRVGVLGVGIGTHKFSARAKRVQTRPRFKRVGKCGMGVVYGGMTRPLFATGQYSSRPRWNSLVKKTHNKAVRTTLIRTNTVTTTESHISRCEHEYRTGSPSYRLHLFHHFHLFHLFHHDEYRRCWWEPQRSSCRFADWQWWFHQNQCHG